MNERTSSSEASVLTSIVHAEAAPVAGAASASV